MTPHNKRNWKENDMSEQAENNRRIMVSVICNTYNHEKYIRDALESMVAQQTDFPFEILVHDDASTDGTAEIIREFEQKYPDLIKPIYQTENQHSQGVSVNSFQYARVKGKYVAFCEGDDYWTDPRKLQKQFDALEQHTELDICVHAANRIDAQTGALIREIAPSETDCVFSAEKAVKKGSFVATNSYFYRADLLQDIPEFRRMQNTDYMVLIHCALRGGILYLRNNMSVYRTNVRNSWSDRMRKDAKTKIAYKQRNIRTLRQLDRDTNGRFRTIIARNILRQRMKVILLKLGLHQ